MDTNLEIAFHNMDPEPGLEEYIRERAEKLERLSDRIVGMRVAVEYQHRQHRTGNVYDVHVELMVPGQDLVVSRKPNRAKERYADPDVRTSIRDAFAAAERQLKEYKAKQRGDVKAGAEEQPGHVSQLYPAEDHGFILTDTGTQLYFHRNSCVGIAFDTLTAGDAVLYVETVGDTGPTAAKVWRSAAASSRLGRH